MQHIRFISITREYPSKWFLFLFSFKSNGYRTVRFNNSSHSSKNRVKLFIILINKEMKTISVYERILILLYFIWLGRICCCCVDFFILKNNCYLFIGFYSIYIYFFHPPSLLECPRSPIHFRLSFDLNCICARNRIGNFECLLWSVQFFIVLKIEFLSIY